MSALITVPVVVVVKFNLTCMVFELKAHKKTRLSKIIATIHHSLGKQVTGRLYYTSSTAMNNGGVAPEDLLKVTR